MTLDAALHAFFGGPAQVVAIAPGQSLVVAFSGGVDSTALLLGLARLAPEAGFGLIAAHLDHGLDAGSGERARAAARIAAAMGVPFEVARRSVPDLRRRGEGTEVAARRLRYAYLEDVRARHGARWVATAHHRGDQAETVLLRLLFGSGVEGLAGIRPVDGAVVRPLLDLPRATLAAAVAEAGLAPLADPGNSDLSVPRNRLRHRVLPALTAEDPEIEERLARLAGAAARARRTLERRFAEGLLPEVSAGLLTEAPGDGRDRGTTAVRREQFARLPEPLRPIALAALHRRAGAPYPASQGARAELARQLASPHRVGCDCGGGWRWQVEGDLLVLRRGNDPIPRGRADGYTPPMPAPRPIEPLFDAEALAGRVAELGRRVRDEVGDEDPLLLALLGGSVIFFADLVRAIGRPLRYELIHIDYSGGAAGPGTGNAAGAGDGDDEVLRIHYPIPIELEGQSVLLVKDVVTSGVIESYLDQQLRERGATAVRVVALIDRPTERKTALEVDYLAFSTDRAGTLVGYGLKHRGRWGNLPYVGLLADGAGRPPAGGAPAETG